MEQKVGGKSGVCCIPGPPWKSTQMVLLAQMPLPKLAWACNIASRRSSWRLSPITNEWPPASPENWGPPQGPRSHPPPKSNPACDDRDVIERILALTKYTSTPCLVHLTASLGVNPSNRKGGYSEEEIKGLATSLPRQDRPLLFSLCFLSSLETGSITVFLSSLSSALENNLSCTCFPLSLAGRPAHRLQPPPKWLAPSGCTTGESLDR